MKMIETEFIPADLNTAVAANEPTRIQELHDAWSFELSGDVGFEALPTYVSTVPVNAPSCSTIEDDDASFVNASRQRLAQQLRDDA